MYSYNYDTVKVITSVDGNNYFLIFMFTILLIYVHFIFRNAGSISIVRHSWR